MASQIYFEMLGGVKIPAVGLGTWQVSDESELVTALNAALEAGYRHIDTAFAYQNEAIIGRVLKEWFSSGKLKREDVFVTTKAPPNGVHQDRVEFFLKKSLENLQLDYVDLYLLHFPLGTKYDETQPMLRELEDTIDHIAIWKKMEEQVDAGRTKTIGLSNFNVRQIDKIFKSARIKPANLQIELHVFLQQRELVKFTQEKGIVIVAYSPLGSPGYNKFLERLGQPPKKLPDMLHDPTIRKTAEKHKKTPAQILLRYLIQKKIVVIPKSVTPSRVKENFNVFDFSLAAGDIKSLDDLDVGEEARVCDWEFFKVFSDHPEWPFPK